jgi:hypothetical protein
MVTACPAGTKHVVVGGTMEQLRSLPSFGQVSKEAVLSFESSLPPASSSGRSVIVAGDSMIPSPSRIRATVIAFDPHNPLQHTVRVGDHLDDSKQESLRSKIVFRRKSLLSSMRIALKSRLKRYRLVRSLHHFVMHKISHGIRVLGNRTIMQGLKTRDRLIHFYVYKIRHGILVLRDKLILQRLRARDRLILLRRRYSTKMTFLADAIRFNRARKALRKIDSKKAKINFDEYSSYL